MGGYFCLCRSTFFSSSIFLLNFFPLRSAHWPINYQGPWTLIVYLTTPALQHFQHVGINHRKYNGRFCLEGYGSGAGLRIRVPLFWSDPDPAYEIGRLRIRIQVNLTRIRHPSSGASPWYLQFLPIGRVRGESRLNFSAKLPHHLSTKIGNQFACFGTILYIKIYIGRYIRTFSVACPFFLEILS